jgi:hypothetical protein
VSGPIVPNKTSSPGSPAVRTARRELDPDSSPSRSFAAPPMKLSAPLLPRSAAPLSSAIERCRLRAHQRAAPLMVSLPPAPQTTPETPLRTLSSW